MARLATACAAALLIFLVATPPRAESYRLSRSGFITHFLALGPIRAQRYDSHDWRRALGVPYIDESTITVGAVSAGEVARLDGGASRTWTPVSSVGPELDLVYEDDRRAVAYLYAELEVTQDFSGWIAAGVDDDLVAWVDGQPLEVPPFPGALALDQHWLPVSLPVGRHALLLKVLNGRGRWAVSVRMVDQSSAAPDGVAVRLPGVDPAGGNPLAALAVDLTPRVRDDGALALDLVVEQRSVRPLRGGVLCMSVPAAVGEAPRCLPSEAYAVAPRRYQIRADAAGLTDGGTVVLALSLRSGGESWERRAELDLPSYSEAVEAVAAARRVLGQLQRGELQLALAAGSLESFEFEVERVSELIAERNEHTSWVADSGRTLAGLTAAFESGVDPYPDRRGQHYRAYRGPIDGRLQPYAIYVPERYGEGRPLPLVVSLHGLHSPVMLNLRRVLGYEVEAGRHADYAVRHMPADLGNPAALFVSPNAYGDSGFRFMGEEDVLRVITEVEAAFAVDTERRYLTGLSLGGIGTFDLGMHRADLFAAALSLCGSADMRLYRVAQRYPTYGWELDLIDEYSAVEYALNAVNLPVYAVHGLQDRTPPSFSAVLIDRLTALGFSASLQTPDLGHNVWRTTYADGGLLSRLESHHRPSFPERVNVRTASYRYAQQFWVRIDALERVHRFGQVQARLARSGEGRRLSVETEGVTGFTLNLSGAPSDWRADALVVEVDGSETCVADCWRDLHFSRSAVTSDARGWTAIEAPLGREGRKRAGLEGPVQDALHEPMAVVYGTADPLQTAFLRRIAMDQRRIGPGIDIELPVLADTEVTPELASTHHLLLLGDMRSNRLLAALAGELPISVLPGEVRVGDRRLAGDDLTAIFIYPNPDQPGRYVLVEAGTSPPAVDAVRFAPRYLPDFVVYGPEARRHFRDSRTFMGAPVRAGGFFEDDWRLPDEGVWLAPEATLAR